MGIRRSVGKNKKSQRPAAAVEVKRDVERAAQILRRSGWRARGEVREGVPLSELLAAIGPAKADVLVLGVRGVGGVERFLLGSVADAATKHSPISVLVVK